MKPADHRALAQLATLSGIQTSYTDMAGKRRCASPEVLASVLASLGVQARTPREVRDALQFLRKRRSDRVVEPVIVAWEGQPRSVPVRFDNAKSRIHLQLEDGSEKLLKIGGQRSACPAEASERRRVVASELHLPRLPHGYHTLTIESRAGSHSSMIISAPTQSYSPPDLPVGRVPSRGATPGQGTRPTDLTSAWGVFLPMYALHSDRSWGAASLGDWEKLAAWLASMGGQVLSTLPLLATFLDFPACEPSPYSPASRLFWNEFFVDIEAIPEFANCRPAQRLVGSAAFRQQLNRFRQSSLVDWPEQWRLRRQVLEKLSDAFFEKPGRSRENAFLAFMRKRPDVVDYARFRAACEKTRTSWRHWPAPMKAGHWRQAGLPSNAVGFHLYAQWIAHEQMQHLLTHCEQLGVKPYLDLPLGVHPDGYDVWRYRGSFALEAKAGAPPDPVFTRGQDWGFAPLHPERIRETGYRYVLDYLRFQMRHTGMLRIDHVMSLHRLYWIPHGATAAEGAYVKYNADELHALFCLESHRHQTMLVGENLGTVPPEVTRRMKRHQFHSMFVVQYSVQPCRPGPLTRRSRLKRPAPASVASLNTHDMPTFAGFWKGLDITDRARLGLIPKRKLAAEHRSRQRLITALCRFLNLPKNCSAEEAFRQTLEWLAASPARILLINLEDLWLETQPQNVPGTSHQRPNWRRRARRSLEEIIRSPQFRELLDSIDRKRQHRAPKRPR